jgi:hypothetical protein
MAVENTHETDFIAWNQKHTKTYFVVIILLTQKTVLLYSIKEKRCSHLNRQLFLRSAAHYKPFNKID